MLKAAEAVGAKRTCTVVLQKAAVLYAGKDAVDITLHLADKPLAGGLYNVGSGEARTWIDLAHAVFAALGRDPQIDFVDMPDALRGKYQYHTCADITKLRATGYSRTITPLQESVRDYVVNYLVPGRFLGDEPPAAA